VFGSSVWDIHTVLKDFDPRNIGCQFDVRHACVEGFNSWVNDLERIAPYIRCYNIKDFHWVLKDGKWQEESVPLGTGVVDFARFFQLLSKHGVAGPVSMHFEYALGGSESGNRKLSVPDETVQDAMKKDLAKLRSLMNP
jgi:sugar phosphate isomerase/epimerase